MARKKQVLTISAMEIWEMRKPKYNAYNCGHGAHGSKKYNRNKVQREFRREYL